MCCVSQEHRRQGFLAIAKAADTKAESAKVLRVKETWRELAEMYRELAQLECRRAPREVVEDRRSIPDRKSIPQRVIRIHRRADGCYVARNEVKTERPLGVDSTLISALRTAKRAAILASRRGYRVVIEVQDAGQSWRQIDVVEP